jgi:hypothetical protein
MYQYYNYLIFEKNKESFNDINPDLRKMTYKYDTEVKNAYMTVQASPEVIKAAMGMNIATQNGHSTHGKVLERKEESKASPPPAEAEKKVAKPQVFSKKGIMEIFQGLDNLRPPKVEGEEKKRILHELLMREPMFELRSKN